MAAAGARVTSFDNSEEQLAKGVENGLSVSITGVEPDSDQIRVVIRDRSTGIADLYPGLSGGAHYPVLSNPMMLLIPPAYVANIDPGILTFDASGNVIT